MTTPKKAATTKVPRAVTGRASAPAVPVQKTMMEVRALPPNQTQIEFYDAVYGNVADGLLARRLAEEIPAKLEYNRVQHGRNGWQASFCKTEDLEELLKELTRKKDWLDVAIVAGMLLVRKDLYNE